MEHCCAVQKPGGRSANAGSLLPNVYPEPLCQFMAKDVKLNTVQKVYVIYLVENAKHKRWFMLCVVFISFIPSFD